MSTEPSAPNGDKRLLDLSTLPAFDARAGQPDDARPQLGEAIKAAVEHLLVEGRATVVGGRIMWPDDVEAEFETALGPKLANALAQPLQHQWVLSYFIAVMLVHGDAGKGPTEVMHQVLATYIGMACGCIPWPGPDRDVEENGGASES